MLAHKRAHHPRRGAAAVEFALVAPLLFMTVAGIIEIGRLVMVAQLATNGSREAARYAVQASATPDAVRTYARTYLAATGIPEDAVTGIVIEQQSGGEWVPVVSLSAVATGTPIRVTLSINYDRVSWLPARFFVGNNTTVQGVSVMRKE